MSVDFSTVYKPSNKEDMEEFTTLLDKALAYRKENLSNWEAREREREIASLELLGIHREDSFLNDYYKKEDEKLQKRKKDEAKRRNENPKLFVKLQFNQTDGKNQLNESLDLLEDTYRRFSIKSESDSGDTDVGIFRLSPIRRQKSPSVCRSEMTITIDKGKYLLNRLDICERKYDICKVKCVLYPRNKKNTKKLKSRETYVNLKGTARCNHVFKLKGFSAEELQQRYIVLEVFGKNNQKKDLIGKIILGGEKCRISDSNLNTRAPTVYEFEPWQQALRNPGITVSMQATIKKSDDAIFDNSRKSLSLNRTLIVVPTAPAARRSLSQTENRKMKLLSL